MIDDIDRYSRGDISVANTIECGMGCRKCVILVSLRDVEPKDMVLDCVCDSHLEWWRGWVLGG